METFLLVLAALFSVINPPGTALVFLSMTKYASIATRRSLARRVALNSFFVMSGSLLIGALVLRLYGISVPVLRVAGGLIVASSGWKLLNDGTRTETEAAAKDQRVDYSGQAFYPLTLPLTTGPGTIAVMISLGLSRSAYSDVREDVGFLLASLLATVVMAAGIYVSFAYSDRVERVLGGSGTDIAARLSAFILFCLGIQIIWTGASDLLASVLHGIPAK
ncbi:MAG TPA: MarC family protein [Bradyrhizobium sp.]|nr:MarC family protein [Bradyrhizobium sp.]